MEERIELGRVEEGEVRLAEVPKAARIVVDAGSSRSGWGCGRGQLIVSRRFLVSSVF